MSNLKKCGCGEIPKSLHISADHDQPKWSIVCGSCCGEWMIEYRSSYKSPASEESMKLAIQAWNDAERAETYTEAEHEKIVQEKLRQQREACASKYWEFESDPVDRLYELILNAKID